MLILCALLTFNATRAVESQADEQKLQEQVMRLASSQEPFDDETLSNVAQHVRQLYVGFELTQADHAQNPELWKQLVGTVIKFYSSCMHSESKENVFGNMMQCLGNLGMQGGHGKINVLMGTQEPELQQDPLETLEEK